MHGTHMYVYLRTFGKLLFGPEQERTFGPDGPDKRIFGLIIAFNFRLKYDWSQKSYITTNPPVN